ncbi:MAG: YcgN family cysteine cluster protein [Gammaproteobacteria bacterium]|nr:YcgN family cysteine cluster protein [Gammaproteobacteria bacterium]
MASKPFWETKTLAELDRDEWEALCDGCGLCCLRKLEDIDSGEIAYTNIACRLLDCDSCSCTDYTHRTERVADCVSLGPDSLDQLAWMPSTCAYRLVDEGRPLPAWHPLVSGKTTSVHAAGISPRGRCISEADLTDDADDADYIVDWVETKPAES